MDYVDLLSKIVGRYTRSEDPDINEIFSMLLELEYMKEQRTNNPSLYATFDQIFKDAIKIRKNIGYMKHYYPFTKQKEYIELIEYLEKI